MSRLISLLASALLAVGASSACVPASYINGVVEKREERTRSGIEEIARSVKCVRSVSEYELEKLPIEIEGLPKKLVRVGHGTGFAYARLEGYTYLITNNHVVSDPDKKEVELKGLGITATYNRVKTTSYVVDNGHDLNPLDDIVLEEVFLDKDKDMALLRTKVSLPVADEFIVDFSFKPERGDEAVLIGYPEGHMLSVTKGIISNPHYGSRGGSHALDVTGTYGNSGSPYFVRRGGKLYWAGIMGAVYNYGDSDVTLFGIGRSIADVQHLIKRGMGKGRQR